ncbi:MAG: tRNA (guanosine(37)-N1)-methyltransferase TrmD [bacterium]
MRFDIITIFPDVFEPYFNQGVIGRAQKRKLAKIRCHNLRDWTSDRRKTVDDKPYGGGWGMVLLVEPILKAITAVKKKYRLAGKQSKRKIILLSAKGKKFDQKMARRWSKLDQLIIVSGRYEGIDERVAKYIADEEISIGDYILTGGEIPAMIIVDAVARLIPGVIKKESLKEESFNELKIENCKLKISHEYPHYTRPEKIVIKGKTRRVPPVLLSGDHKEIENWRQKHSGK